MESFNHLKNSSAHQPSAPSGFFTALSCLDNSFRRKKRLLDLVLCLLAAPLAVSLLLLCACVVWIDDPGPIFFRQWRTGYGGKRFLMWKFRTMRTNAEAMKEQLWHLNELTWPDFKISNDPRMTRAGRILRKLSLDEIPQIINVLRGEMSWVGPRPTSFDASTYDLIHTERLEAVPGITGLWQISGRSDVDFDERLKLDIEYIERQSITFDLMILFKTVGAVVHPTGAY